VAANERAFYAKETWDFEVNTSIAGWLELIADNYRTDHDIQEHMNGCKKDIRARVFDANNQPQAIVPHIWEISIGVDRTVYAVLEWALKENKKKKPLLDLNPALAPATVSIFPLVEKPDFIAVARKSKSNCATTGWTAGTTQTRPSASDTCGRTRSASRMQLRLTGQRSKTIRSQSGTQHRQANPGKN